MDPSSELIENLVAQGALGADPIVEFGGYVGVQALGGTAVLPWRADHLAAVTADVKSVAAISAHQQAVHTAIVHVQKSRDATWTDLADAWARIGVNGRLFVVGSNALGVRSVAKRLGEQLAATPLVLLKRRHGRVLRFERTDRGGPIRPEVSRFDVAIAPIPAFTLISGPGVFSAGRLDTGSALLLESLARTPPTYPPRRILDLGCGSGVLAIWALSRWPNAVAVLCDADARAVRAARSNTDSFGASPRAKLVWWDVSESLREPAFDLVVINPPFHRNTCVDLQLPEAMLRAGRACLAPGGELRVVANRKLPYEALLAPCTRLAERDGFKVLASRGAAGDDRRR